MIIANPIYDTVFKKMMENERVVKFFIGTIIDEEIVNIELKPQEYTYKGEFEKDDPRADDIIEERIRKRYSIWLYRLDFIATIKTKKGEFRKVLIEIQKAKNQIDLMRFRNYLAEQYKKEDKIENRFQLLPITTIYILGFTLPEITTACLKVDRVYRDLLENTIIETKSDFVEKLTHDCYIVQVNRITNRYQTSLDKLLSVFEQNNFIDDNKIIKDYFYTTDNEDLKIITEILHHSGSNPEQRKKIEMEQEAIRTINALYKDNEKVIEEKEREIEEKEKVIGEKEKVIGEKEKVIGEKEKVIGEKEKVIEEQEKLIEELIKKLKKK